MNTVKSHLVVLGTLALCGVAGTAHAAVVSESFNYATGALAGNNGGTGWAAAWAAVAGIDVVDTSANPLAFSSGAVSVNGGTRAVEITQAHTNGDPAVSRQFASAITSEPVFFSLLFRASNLDTASTSNNPSGNDFIQFMLNNDTAYAQSVSLGDFNTTTSATGHTLAGRVNGSGTGNVASDSFTYSRDTTYLLVGRVDKAEFTATSYDKVTIWVNPNVLSEPTGASHYEASSANISAPAGMDLTSLAYFTMRTVNFSATNDGVYAFDELRVGDSYDAVVVPEPASGMLLAGAASLGLLRRRRAARERSQM